MATVIKEGDCYDACNFSCHCENWSYQIQVIEFYQYYSPVAHSDEFRINIYIAAMNRLTSIIFDVINVFQKIYFPIHEIVCVIPPPYYLDWLEKSYPSVTLNQDEGPFCLQCMIGFKEKIHQDFSGTDSLMQWFSSETQENHNLSCNLHCGISRWYSILSYSLYC